MLHIIYNLSSRENVGMGTFSSLLICGKMPWLHSCSVAKKTIPNACRPRSLALAQGFHSAPSRNSSTGVAKLSSESTTNSSPCPLRSTHLFSKSSSKLAKLFQRIQLFLHTTMKIVGIHRRA